VRGLGPYRYYDTHLLDTDPGYDDKHGWGALASLAAEWYLTNQWLEFLGLNQVAAARGFDSTSAALGVGYRFADLFNGAAGERPSAPKPWEVDGLIGERIQNSADSKAGLAESVDLRRQLSDHFALSASLIAGQDTNLECGNTNFNAENLVAATGDYWGVMALTLNQNGYAWKFQSAVAGPVNNGQWPVGAPTGSYTDNGIGICHGPVNR
jgi:hypothetical protein